MPIDSRPGPVDSDSCCFCGESVESDPERTRLSARWTDDGREHLQEWDAHRKCLLERMDL